MAALSFGAEWQPQRTGARLFGGVGATAGYSAAGRPCRGAEWRGSQRQIPALMLSQLPEAAFSFERGRHKPHKGHANGRRHRKGGVQLRTKPATQQLKLSSARPQARRSGSKLVQKHAQHFSRTKTARLRRLPALRDR